MIELKAYHSNQSPEIQGIWQEDHFCLRKIVTIAYKILIENVGIFFYNQSARIRNYFKKEAATPSVDAPLPFSATRVLAPMFPDMFQITTNVFFLSALFLPIVVNPLAPLQGTALGCEAHWLLQMLQGVIQQGAKPLILASAAIPLTINFADAFQKEPKNTPFTTKITNVVQKQFSAPHFIFYSSTIGLALTHTLYGKAFGLSSKDGFDASSYFMLKTALAPIAKAAFSQTALKYPVFTIAFTSANALIEHVFFTHTLFCSNTAQECLAGFASGFGILATSYLLNKTCIWLNSSGSKPVTTTRPTCRRAC